MYYTHSYSIAIDVVLPTMVEPISLLLSSIDAAYSSELHMFALNFV